MANCLPKVYSFLNKCSTGCIPVGKRCDAVSVEVRPPVHIHTMHVPVGWFPTSHVRSQGLAHEVHG